MKLHLFDFDGTISKSDSMLEFLKYLHKYNYYIILIKSIPAYIKFKINLISKKEFKVIFLKNFLSNFSKNDLESSAKNFLKIYYGHLKISAINYIKSLKKNDNNKIVIVSASLDIWIKPIADHLGVNSITTISDFKNDVFFGFKGENCWGMEKVKRIKSIYNLSDFTEICAYGDSMGDIEMLNIAHIKKFKYFN